MKLTLYREAAVIAARLPEKKNIYRARARNGGLEWALGIHRFGVSSSSLLLSAFPRLPAKVKSPRNPSDQNF
jgi:hypothetical protein